MSLRAWLMVPGTLTRVVLPAAMLAGLLLASGCDSEDDFDHTPAAGQGALIVDNQGVMDVDVFVDGALIGEVRDGDWKAFDLAPGVPRVVVDEDDGDRSFATDVDILEDRNTILTVTVASDSTLNATLYID